MLKLSPPCYHIYSKGKGPTTFLKGQTSGAGCELFHGSVGEYAGMELGGPTLCRMDAQ